MLGASMHETLYTSSKMFPPAQWSSCTQALLAFKAKFSGCSSVQLHMLRLSWRAVLRGNISE